ncbi:MAG: hypothetical protein FWG54_02550 [Bacteroidetes bacterium]|nr:hypothetical protein [Bacteroidota bacterium]
MGVDAEATVDGVHLTDLGFLRMAEALSSYVHAHTKFRSP